MSCDHWQWNDNAGLESSSGWFPWKSARIEQETLLNQRYSILRSLVIFSLGPSLIFYFSLSAGFPEKKTAPVMIFTWYLCLAFQWMILQVVLNKKTPFFQDGKSIKIHNISTTLSESNSKKLWKWMIGRLLSAWEGQISGALADSFREGICVDVTLGKGWMFESYLGLPEILVDHF